MTAQGHGPPKGQGPGSVRCSFENSHKRDEAALTLRAKCSLMHRSEASSLDHFVSGHLQGQWHFEAKCLRGVEIDDQLDSGRL